MDPFWRSDNGKTMLTLYQGHVLDVLRAMPAESVHCIVTSPPYFGLRNYKLPPQVWGGEPGCEHDFAEEELRVEVGSGNWTQAENGPGLASGRPQTRFRGDYKAARENTEWATVRRGFCLRCSGWRGSLGLEPTPGLYVQHLVEIFREVRRVLRRDGTLWCNLGDSYAASPKGNLNGQDKSGLTSTRTQEQSPVGIAKSGVGLKPKDLLGMPWRVVFALQADGWWLRSGVVEEVEFYCPCGCGYIMEERIWRYGQDREIIWCLSASTRVYARTAHAEGPMTIHDLVRLDPATVQLWNGERWTQVCEWTSRESETLHLALRSGERIVASPNHRWPLADERVVETRDLRVGDVLATARLPEPEQPRDEGIPADLAWFAGLYLAEGSHSDDAIQIAGHVDEVEHHERTIAIAERYGGSAVVHAGLGNDVSVVVHGAFPEAALRHFIAGRTALDKHLHARAWRSSNATLRAIMDGYLAGDGHYEPENDRWRLGFGNNPQLADSFRTLAARLDATLTLSATLVQMGRTRTFEAYRGEWRWQRSGHYNEKPRSEIIAIEPRAETEVWDIGVEDEPHLFALASGVLTHNSKPNPMPESVTDRPTTAHEYLFLLSKSATYYYDADAIREPHSWNGEGWAKGWMIGKGSHGTIHPDGRTTQTEADEYRGKTVEDPNYRGRRQAPEPGEPNAFHPSGRNKRTVWTIATEPSNYEFCLNCDTFFDGARRSSIRVEKDADGKVRRVCPVCGKDDSWVGHFATFPEALVEPCILAGTSEKGVCPECGALWERMIERRYYGSHGPEAVGNDPAVVGMTRNAMGGQREWDSYIPPQTLGWKPGCADGKEPVPATVLDPFSGSGTALLVAQRLGRNGVGIELSEPYIHLAIKRLRAEHDQMRLSVR